MHINTFYAPYVPSTVYRLGPQPGDRLLYSCTTAEAPTPASLVQIDFAANMQETKFITIIHVFIVSYPPFASTSASPVQDFYIIVMTSHHSSSHHTSPALSVGNREDAAIDLHNPTTIKLDRVLKMKGLPFKANVEDVLAFYQSYGVGADGVFLKRNADGKLNGEVCLESRLRLRFDDFLGFNGRDFFPANP